MSSLQKFPFKSFAHFSLEYTKSVEFRTSLFTREETLIKYLIMYLFFHSVGCKFTLLCPLLHKITYVSCSSFRLFLLLLLGIYYLLQEGLRIRMLVHTRRPVQSDCFQPGQCPLPLCMEEKQQAPSRSATGLAGTPWCTPTAAAVWKAPR